MPLFLTSLEFTGLGAWLPSHAHDGPALVIHEASRDLPDRADIRAAAMAALAAEGVTPDAVQLDSPDPATLRGAAIIAMTGGDPFLLLRALRRSGADSAVSAAAARGAIVIGQSAGALVCAPTLEPLRLTSPFRAPERANLRGLTLTEHLILPHHDRAGRADRHRQAALAFAPKVPLVALRDDEALLLDGVSWAIHHGGGTLRPARPGDAAGVAGVFHAAGAAGWRDFIDPTRLADAPLELDQWQQRIAELGRRFLISEDAAGINAFVATRRSADDPSLGEVHLLYVHPRAWGAGLGRRLLDHATWNLLAEGCRRAGLWTEARNARALALYHQAGWREDGAVDERDYLGTPIRNVRLGLDLTRHAGGGEVSGEA